MSSSSLSRNKDLFEGKLKSAESAICFLQDEHRRVLSGLHEEIRRLQQKCSDLQFTLTTTNASAKAEKELRAQVQRLQSDTDQKDTDITTLNANLKSNSDRVEELAEQLKWREVEFQNQLDSREAKISQLQKSLTTQKDVSRLQSDVKRLYAEREEEVRVKAEDVARRARGGQMTPDMRRVDVSASIAVSGGGNEDQLQEHRPVLKSASSNNAAAATRAKVFRHKLRQRVGTSEESSQHRRRDSIVSNGSGVSGNNVLVCSIDDLPRDYKSAVATLPPILAGSGTGGDAMARDLRRRNSEVRKRSVTVEYEVAAMGKGGEGEAPEGSEQSPALGQSFA